MKPSLFLKLIFLLYFISSCGKIKKESVRADAITIDENNLINVMNEFKMEKSMYKTFLKSLKNRQQKQHQRNWFVMHDSVSNYILSGNDIFQHTDTLKVPVIHISDKPEKYKQNIYYRFLLNFPNIPISEMSMDTLENYMLGIWKIKMEENLSSLSCRSNGLYILDDEVLDKSEANEISDLHKRKGGPEYFLFPFEDTSDRHHHATTRFSTVIRLEYKQYSKDLDCYLYKYTGISPLSHAIGYPEIIILSKEYGILYMEQAGFTQDYYYLLSP